MGAIVNDEDVSFEVLCNEEVQYVDKHIRGSWLAFQRQVGNEGWINERDSNWRDRD